MVPTGDTAISLRTQVFIWGALDQCNPKSLNLAKFSFFLVGSTLDQVQPKVPASLTIFIWGEGEILWMPHSSNILVGVLKEF